MRKHMFPLQPQRVFKLVALLIATTASALVSAASTPTVTINFTGKYVLYSCGITGGVDQTVTLPTVSDKALNSPGSTAGSTPFHITVNCDGEEPTTPGSGVKGVRAFFEPGTTVDAGTGNLINLPAPGGATAGGVQIQLLNEDNSVIKIGDRTTMPFKAVGAAGGDVRLNYVARYYAAGTVTPGTVQTYVTYILEMP